MPAAVLFLMTQMACCFGNVVEAAVNCGKVCGKVHVSAEDRGVRTARGLRAPRHISTFLYDFGLLPF